MAMRARGSAWPSAWALLWPIPALALVALLEWGSRSLWPTFFFALTLLWPASLAARQIGGVRWGDAIGITFAVLLVLHAALPQPLPDRQPATLERRFVSRDEAMRHIIAPGASAEWRRAQERAPAPEAWIYVLTLLGAEISQPQLTLTLNQRHTARLDAASRLHPEAPPAAERHEWHRVRVHQAALGREGPIEVVIEPDASAPFTPGTVGLVGGYSYRPSSPPAPSAFFDGMRWTVDPATLLSTLPGETRPTQLDGPLRYFIELRLVDPETRRILAAVY